MLMDMFSAHLNIYQKKDNTDNVLLPHEMDALCYQSIYQTTIAFLRKKKLRSCSFFFPTQLLLFIKRQLQQYPNLRPLVLNHNINIANSIKTIGGFSQHRQYLDYIVGSHNAVQSLSKLLYFRSSFPHSKYH